MPRVPKKKASKKKTRKPATQKGKKVAGEKPQLCMCGCDVDASRGCRFLQGHDAKFHGRVKKLKDGRLSMAELPALGVKAYAIPLYRKAAGKK